MTNLARETKRLTKKRGVNQNHDIRVRDKHIKALQNQLDGMESLLCALYQVCGAYDAPDRVMDVIRDAKNGEPISETVIDDLLPCNPHEDVEHDNILPES